MQRTFYAQALTLSSLGREEKQDHVSRQLHLGSFWELLEMVLHGLFCLRRMLE